MMDQQAQKQIIDGLTPAQRRFMAKGEESIFADRRVTRALCGKGLMGLAGYVTGGFELFCFTAVGHTIRAALQPAIDGGEG